MTGIEPVNGQGVEVRAVSKQFVSRAGRQTALSAVDLTIAPGQFVSLLGPSGCGKTSLLRIIGGLLEPTTGTVSIDGRSVDDAVRARKFGFVFQDATLLPWRTVRANAMLLLDVIGRRNEEARVDALLETVGLSNFANHYPAQLSGGMRQRVALARALALDPEILLMDEPFAALDAITRERLGVELLGIWDGARAVVFVTHSISEAVLLSDRVVVMSTSPGRVVADIAIDLPRPRNGAVRLSEPFKTYEDQLRGLIEGVRA
ncbi:MAG TPA: ABC transporter ATP-binding protein [Caldimonas sp.]|nr:ABC transporter ATP-binding protein [Caldimonas sp.]